VLITGYGFDSFPEKIDAAEAVEMTLRARVYAQKVLPHPDG
jgi:hypothetical protein